MGIAVCSTSMSIWQLVSPDDPELEGERGKFGKQLLRTMTALSVRLLSNTVYLVFFIHSKVFA